MIKTILNFIFLPLRVLLPNRVVEKIGLTSLKQERMRAVFKKCKGRVIDIGCQYNELIKEYKNGIGIDIYPWPGADLVINPEKLPFPQKSFDTATFVASLNHIPNRSDVIKEVNRILKDNGRIIITMLNPAIGWLCHKLAWYDEDQNIRKMKPNEKYGLSKKEILEILEKNSFKLSKHKKFVYGLNNLYVFKKTV